MISKKRLLTLLLSVTLCPLLSMGSSKEAIDYKKESELNKSQPNYFATAVYQDGTEVNIEGININGKTKVKNTHLKTKRGKGPIVPSNIRLKSVEKVVFGEGEGTSIVATVKYKSGKIFDYLFDSHTKFGGWIEGTDRSSTCTLEIGKLKEIIIHGPKHISSKTIYHNKEAKEVLEADSSEPLDYDKNENILEHEPVRKKNKKVAPFKSKKKKATFSMLG